MVKITVGCSFCERQISKSNIKKHEEACCRPKVVKKTASERQLSIPADIRKARAQKAQKARQKAHVKKRQERLQSEPFINLNKSEKREKIFTEQGGKCDICENDKWNDLPITLELDHISGNRLDETRDNLRLICPNCHSQTPTYKRLNSKYSNQYRYSDDEILDVLKSADSLYKVLIKLELNTSGGNYARLRRIIQEYDVRKDLF